MIFLSQGWDDCDKKIRTLCTEYFFLRRLGPFTLIRRIQKTIDIDDQGQIIDKYQFAGLFSRGLSFIYRPRFYHLFDSWDAPSLDDYHRDFWYKKEKVIDFDGGARNEVAPAKGSFSSRAYKNKQEGVS